MRFSDLIAAKRDGAELSEAEVALLVRGVTDDDTPPEQIGAMLMAIYLNGMTTTEMVALTREMRDSGQRLEWGDNSLLVDKHSTGGVGDKVSLVLAPVLAACGLRVPMIAGRGLEHTGGTIDKLESIPGYKVSLGPAEIQRVVAEVGCSISTQTEEMIPADRVLYAMRDVTNTVASLPLIVGSILSKKLAEGIGSLLLDIKVGSAAFMRDVASATQLANAMVAVGCSMGVETAAMLTTMDEPLGRMAGNSLEVIECVELMAGDGSADLMELVVEQAAHLLQMSGVESQLEPARRLALTSLEDASALARFEQMLCAQGVADSLAARICTDPRGSLRTGAATTKLFAEKSGYVSHIDAMLVAQHIISLAGGRTKRGAALDHGVGVELMLSRGDRVEQGQQWAIVHHSDSDKSHEPLEAALSICSEPIEEQSRIIEVISR